MDVDMRLGAYLNVGSDEIYIEIEPRVLMKGKDVYDALKKAGITKENFVLGVLVIEDSGIRFSYPLRTFEEFVEHARVVRMKAENV